MVSGATKNTFSHGQEAMLSLVGKREISPNSERWWQEWFRFLQITARWQHRTRNCNSHHNYDHRSSKPFDYPSYNTPNINTLANVNWIKIFWFHQLILLKNENKWRGHDYWFQETFWQANSGRYGNAVEGMQVWTFGHRKWWSLLLVNHISLDMCHIWATNSESWR